MSARKTVIYARASLTGRRGDALIDRQVETCRRYAHECDLPVAEVLADQGGLHDPRPALDRLIEGADAGEVGTVVIRDLDVLSPGMLESVDLVARLGKSGVRIRAVEKTDWMLELADPDPEQA